MTTSPLRLSGAIGLVVLLGCAGMWGIGNLLTRPTNADVAAPPPPARTARIDSTGDIRLAASYWPVSEKDAPSILMLHGNGSNRGATYETAAWLNQHGYAVLAIDFRGHGQSSPAKKSFGLREAEDAHAALAWLRRERPEARVGVIGFSLGGAASLLGEAGPLPVDAFVLQGVYPDIRRAVFNRLASRLGTWPATIIEPLLSYQSLPRLGVWPSRISPVAALSRVSVPVLIVGGGADVNTPPRETRDMYEAVREHGEIHILAGVGHNELGRIAPGPFRQVVLAFLDRSLRSPGP